MGDKKSIFQIVVFALFVFFIVIAILMFARFSGGGSSKDIGDVVMWGTYDSSMMDTYLNKLKDIEPAVGRIFYEQIPHDTFNSRLAEALASGEGPDIFVLTQDNIIYNWNKILPFSFNDISKRTYKDSFISEADMFIGTQGIQALPFSVNPLVLYYNGDILGEAGVAKPPMYWSEMYGLAERITRRDKANNILRSTIAFGEFGNVDHAKDILSMLIMQAGGNIVNKDKNGKLSNELLQNRSTDSNSDSPIIQVLRFYTNFANPVQNIYSWNRSMPSSLDAFAQGKLAFYIGYASEKNIIRLKNPNLNYSVAPIPQIKEGIGHRVVTFGKISALAIPKAAHNIYGGEKIAQILTNTKASKLFSDLNSTPSVRLDILSPDPEESWALIFRNAALISRAWYDPNPLKSTSIFRKMIGDVNSGALNQNDAAQRAYDELSLLLKNN